MSFVTPTNGARIDKGELVTITLNATDKNDDLHEVLVSVDGETLVTVHRECIDNQIVLWATYDNLERCAE